MSTPKEKAKELINNFSRTHVIGVENTKGKLVSPYSSGYASIEVRNIRAKNSALIAVDEIDDIYQKLTPKDDPYYFLLELEYWQEVKQEIEKL